jgi:hypothetical protein
MVIVYAPLFMALTFLEFKMIEEPELEKRLGAAYVEYRKRSPCSSRIQATANIHVLERTLTNT